ncbi:MAG: flavodoxin family protein [Lysobacter sp.]|nr:flavodoxin family protein [Lysobacter sp.]
MKCLVVIAHPLQDSLCASLARLVVDALIADGHEVETESLYADGFQPALGADERSSYYAAGGYDGAAVSAQLARLSAAEALVLVFPTWWFGFPAMLKGWFDRVWAPGHAYRHASDLSAIEPALHGLRRTIAITTLGSPWWVDWLWLRRPVRRVLARALLGACAPRCRLDMLSLYRAEHVERGRLERFERRILARLRALR